MEYSTAYFKIPEYAKIHNFKLENGLYTTKNKVDDYLSETKFLSEININLFVIVKFAGDCYVCIMKSEGANDISKLTSVINMIKNFKELLIVTKDTKSTKLINLASEHTPKINFINLPAFITNPMAHCFSPKSITKIDYEEEAKVILIEKKDLLEIDFHDPVIAWLRFKPGDVLCILNRSFVCGFDTHYRLVKKVAK